MMLPGGSEQLMWNALDRLRGPLDAQHAQQLLLRVLFLRGLSDASDGRVPRGGLGLREVMAQGMHRGEAAHTFMKALDDAWASSYPHGGWLPSESIPINPAAEPFLREVFWLIDGADNPHQLFEECLERFSSSKTGGNYFTPRHLVRLMVEMTEPQQGERILDPACGSGGFLAESARYVHEHQGPDAAVRLTGRDVHPVARQTTWMNLTVQGLEADLGTQPVDSLWADDTPAADFDVVFANPPFNLKVIGDELRGYDPRWRYGVPPRSNANFAWIQHVVSKLTDQGRGAMLLPDGAAFVGGAARSIREGLVTDGVLSAVVALPHGMLAHTGIKTSIWIFNREKAATRLGQILFIDARELGGATRTGRRTLSEDEIDRITNTYRSWRGDGYQNQAGWCHSANIEEMKAREFDLQAVGYIDVPTADDSAHSADQRVAELTSELYGLFTDAARLEAELRFLLEDL